MGNVGYLGIFVLGISHVMVQFSTTFRARKESGPVECGN